MDPPREGLSDEEGVAGEGCGRGGVWQGEGCGKGRGVARGGVGEDRRLKVWKHPMPPHMPLMYFAPKELIVQV